MRIFTRPQFFNPLVLFSLLIVGCDTTPHARYDKLNLLDASGTITLDGAPLPNAVVVFEDENGRFSAGLTDADGDYTLRFNSEVDGVTPGKKTVRISTTRKISGLNTTGEGDILSAEAARQEGMKAAPADIELVPEQYNRKSGLNVTVKPDEDQTFDFDLKSPRPGE